MIKNHDVAKVNFENLWIVSKLFASDDWRVIQKQLEEFLQTKIIINPLFGENALIKGQSRTLFVKKESGKPRGIFISNLKDGTTSDTIKTMEVG